MPQVTITTRPLADVLADTKRKGVARSKGKPAVAPKVADVRLRGAVRHSKLEKKRKHTKRTILESVVKRPAAMRAFNAMGATRSKQKGLSTLLSVLAGSVMEEVTRQCVQLEMLSGRKTLSERSIREVLKSMGQSVYYLCSEKEDKVDRAALRVERQKMVEARNAAMEKQDLQYENTRLMPNFMAPDGPDDDSAAD